MAAKKHWESKFLLALLLALGITLLVVSGIMRNVNEKTSVALFTFGITIFLLGIFFYLIYNMLCVNNLRN
jgi:hypothetical protein